METVFKIVGDAEHKAEISVKLTVPKHTLTRDELRSWKEKIQNKLHMLLVDDGYSVCRIKLK